LLLWDRQDREVSYVLAEKMIVLSRQMKEQASLSATQFAISASTNEINDKRTGQIIDEVMDVESQITTVAVQMELEYVSEFKIHAAEALLDILAKIYGQVLYSLLLMEQRKYFRYDAFEITSP
jgi:hypothetical protein